MHYKDRPGACSMEAIEIGEDVSENGCGDLSMGRFNARSHPSRGWTWRVGELPRRRQVARVLVQIYQYVCIWCAYVVLHDVLK